MPAVNQQILDIYCLIACQWRAWLTAAGIVLAFWVGGFLFRKVVVVYIEFLTRKTETKIDDVIISCLKPHLIYWPVLLGLYFAAKAAPVENAHVLALFNKTVLALFFLSVTFLVSNIVSGIFKVYTDKHAMPSASLTNNVIKFVVIAVGALVILSQLGISITPLLTALGIGSLAVALAFQDTLSNMFAGFHIIMSKLIKTGDYIKLESGETGYVLDIGWRATRIRELSNNVILVPNSKITASVLKNFYAPDKEMAVLVQVGVSYNSDLAKVEKVTIEVGEEIMKTVQGGIPDFKPFIRYHTLGDSSINFSVILRAKEVVDQYLITHEFIKRLHKRYKQEGIEIPFPQRVVHLQK
ncbi:MAG: mechanosensitive ion channel family protein [Elusimicrobiota bacterium]